MKYRVDIIAACPLLIDGVQLLNSGHAPAAPGHGKTLRPGLGLVPVGVLIGADIPFQSRGAIGNNPGKPGTFEKIFLLIVIAAAVALFAACCRSLTEIVREAQTQVVTDHVADVIHGKSVAVDLEYYEDPKYYDTLHRAQEETTFRPATIMHNLTQLGQSGISLVALAGLLVSFRWWVAVMLFVATVPGVWMRLKYANLLYEWQRRHTQAQRRADYFHRLLTDGGHAKEIRLFGLGSLFMDRFRDLRQKLRVERLKPRLCSSLGRYG